MGFCALVASGKALRVGWPAAQARKDTILQIWYTLLSDFSTTVSMFMKHLYPSRHDCSRGPPPLLYGRPGVRKKVAALDPETAWRAIQRAKDCHSHNMKLVLQIKNDEREYNGIAASHGATWQRLILLMYYRLNRPFFIGRKQIVTIADPSSHCGDETLVGIVYSWEREHAAYGPVKIIPPSTILNLDEIPIAPELKEKLFAQGMTRKKSYRQFQAVMALQHDITGNGLEDYAVPPGM